MANATKVESRGPSNVVILGIFSYYQACHRVSKSGKKRENVIEYCIMLHSKKGNLIILKALGNVMVYCENTYLTSTQTHEKY